MEMTERLPVVYVDHYIKLTFLFSQFGFQLVDLLKLGATRSDILDYVTYVTIRR